ncbi:Uncharacterized protein AXF42_Ash018110 [Apostasia shenzhenica]|uniref:Cell wall hydroxyproline-rich glycoprotein n=1 Tax=Apostasia shenzhenica TaxID=1088818 RepID=A0A2I0AEX5_9ASPA|nr:Uncharacterized protein AXF42_Ash018110 [Apostasia shenzhenica]
MSRPKIPITTNPTLLLLLCFLVGEQAGKYGGISNPSHPPCPCSQPPQPPAPAPSPADLQPSDFPNLKQYEAYLVIQRFKKTITCDPNNVTSSWTGPRPCSYRGFFCGTPPVLPAAPTIASVDFNGFRLCAPTLSGFLDRLPDLALFHANSNNFSSTVPDLSSLPFLYELDLSNNRLSGDFPAAVLPLSQLTFLDLRFNLFSGAVPPSAFFLPVGVLFLNNNLFQQSLPASIGSSPVAFLTLANNAFTGPIPRSIGNASGTLVEVLFLNNRLSGCLPFEVGLLRASTVFDAGFNQITGPIPCSFACLFKIEQLNLAGNLLYGTVPDVLCRLAQEGNLANLSLSGNYFTWLGHSCWGLIKSGVLDVRQNCILGVPEQRPAAECAKFLLHCKFCPILTHIPCKLPYWTWHGIKAVAGENATAASHPSPHSTTTATTNRSLAPSYRTYLTVDRPKGS